MNTRQSLPSPPSEAVALGSQLYLGPNFSGRSLKLVELVKSAEEDGFSIAPDVTSTFSGLAATVEKELEYFYGTTEVKNRSIEFLDSLGMKYILSRNPLTLSGGEQVMAALAMAIASNAKVVGADCCFEQLDWHIRSVIFERFRKFSSAALLSADNRADEHFIPEFIQQIKLSPTKETTASKIDYKLVPNREFKSKQLVLENITARYNPQSDFMLSIPSLSLLPGRVYRLAGSNGAGKTTFSRMLVGLLRLTSGTIWIGDRKADIWRHPGRIAAMAFQNPDYQLFGDTVESELLARGCHPDLLEPILRGFGVVVPGKSHPSSLPFVLRKRLSLAAMFSASCGWYILDEPTIGQDSDSIKELAVLLKRIASLGCGIIVITHSERFASLLDAHQIVLKGGKYVKE